MKTFNLKWASLALVFCLLAPTSAWALKNDTEQPVFIDSDSQQVDMKSNQVTFSGNVSLKQGSIRVNADKLVIYRNNKTGEVSMIKGYGKPARFSQKTDDGKTLKGQANNLDYNLAKDSLILTTHAELHQDGSIIKGDKISYTISTQTLKADSGQGQRVSTVLQPQEN